MGQQRYMVMTRQKRGDTTEWQRNCTACRKQIRVGERYRRTANRPIHAHCESAWFFACRERKLSALMAHQARYDRWLAVHTPRCEWSSL